MFNCFLAVGVGVDILDPIQLNALQISAQDLKSKFGNNLCFHGGVDTQNLLPFGEKEEIVEQVGELIHVLGKGGGYIMSGSHFIQADVGVEKILTMFDAAVNWQKDSRNF